MIQIPFGQDEVVDVGLGNQDRLIEDIDPGLAGIRVLPHLANEIDLGHKPLLRSPALAFRSVVAGVGQRGLVEPAEPGVDLTQRAEAVAIPELAREDRVVALDGGLREGFARHGEDRKDLALERKHHEARQAAPARAGADGRLGVVDLHHVGVFEGAEELLTSGQERRRGLRFNPLKIPQFRRLLEAEADKMHRRAAPGEILLADEIHFQDTPAEGLVDRVLGIAQIARSALDALLRALRQALLGKDPSDGAQRRRLGLGIPGPVTLLDRARAAVEGARAALELRMQPADPPARRLIPLPPLALLPAAGVLRGILGSCLRPAHDKPFADAQQIGNPRFAVADLKIQIVHLAAQINGVFLSVRRSLLCNGYDNFTTGRLRRKGCL